MVVVEHEEEVIRSADHSADIGPEAGVHGVKNWYSANPAGPGRIGEGKP